MIMITKIYIYLYINCEREKIIKKLKKMNY